MNAMYRQAARNGSRRSQVGTRPRFSFVGTIWLLSAQLACALRSSG
jgi:hypothetical protein